MSQLRIKKVKLMVMAIIQFSGIGVTNARGKLGGTVFSANRGGSYLRNKGIPLNPQTGDQTTARNRLTNYSQNWRALTAAQRDDWNAMTANYTYTNSLGQPYTLSGQELYIALNAGLTASGASAITTPLLPAGVEPMETGSGAAAAGAQTFTLTFTPTPVPANTKWMVYATPGLSPGKTFVKNRLRLITSLAAATATGASIAAAYIAKYGSVPAAGSLVSLLIIPINTNTGQQGTGFRIDVIVAA